MIWTTEFQYKTRPATQFGPLNDKLMVVLHGLGDSYRPFLSLPEELKLPDLNYIFLNAPFKYDRGYSWYNLEPRHQKGILASRSRLHALVDELQMQGWPSPNIFFFGLSQGCLMACDLAMTYPDRLAGIIGVSGYVWFFPAWRRKLSPAALKSPWLMSHGCHDDVLPLKGTLRQVERLRASGLKHIQWLEFDKEHELDSEKEAPVLGRWVRAQAQSSLGSRWLRSLNKPPILPTNFSGFHDSRFKH